MTVKKESSAQAFLGNASLIAIIFGVGYLIDCRLGGGDVDKCWLTGASLAGIGTVGRTAYHAGYWTPNPGIAQAERNRVAPMDTPKE